LSLLYDFPSRFYSLREVFIKLSAEGQELSVPLAQSFFSPLRILDAVSPSSLSVPRVESPRPVTSPLLVRLTEFVELLPLKGISCDGGVRRKNGLALRLRK
jgi:hypothetical protein